MAKKSVLSKKSLFQKIQPDGQHWDASESRANFGIYVENQKHPNLSTQTYGFSHVI